MAGNLTAQCVATLAPGDNYQGRVDACPAATAFTLSAGTFRNFSVTPQNNDSFTGVGPTTDLTGATVITPTASGAYWTAGSLPAGQTTGNCQATYPGCIYPNDVYYDSVPLVHVTSLGAVVPGAWFQNLGTSVGYFADNPAGHVVEIATTRAAFEPGGTLGVGASTGVTISNLTIEKYAIPAQMGAIGDQYPGTGWTINNVIGTLNHGAAVHLNSSSSVNGGKFNSNGQQGISASGSNVTIQNAEIGWNNWAGFDSGWEAGGTKSSNSNTETISWNYVHDNNGPGIWCDINCIYTTYTGNTVLGNTGPGITHEISYDCTISGNTVSNNGIGANSPFLWGSQIQLQNSQNCTVSGNTVTVAPYGNGIGMINQNRGSGTYGPWVTANNSITHNTIIYQYAHIGPNPTGPQSGWITDYGGTCTGCVMDYNNYFAPSGGNGYFWVWPNGYQYLSGFQSGTGQETHGTFATQASSLPNAGIIGATTLTGGAQIK